MDRLSRFEPRFASMVARWVQTDRELLWLAPGTTAPLTADKLAAWGSDRPTRYLYWRPDSVSPCAYSELNPMPETIDQLWIGHFLVDPACRGQAVGRSFVSRLLELAFVGRQASAVWLVVFPENVAAIRCYEACGMVSMGRESRYFQTTRRRHEFLRMGIDRATFERSLRDARQSFHTPSSM